MTLFEKIKFWAPMWGGMIPIQVLGIYSIFATMPSYWWVATIVGYVCIMMLGLAICYHRYLSHKSFETPRFIKQFMLWCAILSGQGSPIFWVVIHRGYHHRLADTDRDPHSPKHGFWHSYVTWMFKIKPGDMHTKYTVDLLRDKDVVFCHHYYIWIFWISNIVLAAISINIWLYGVILPAFIAFHSYALNTSMNHWTTKGYKNYQTKDDGLNVVWLFPLILGEAWHNNHHGDAKNSNFGGRKWWEFDPAYWLIKLIRTN